MQLKVSNPNTYLPVDYHLQFLIAVDYWILVIEIYYSDSIVGILGYGIKLTIPLEENNCSFISYTISYN